MVKMLLYKKQTFSNPRLTLLTLARVPATMNMLVKQIMATSIKARITEHKNISKLSEPAHHLSSHSLIFVHSPRNQLFLTTFGPYAESL